MFFNQSYIKFFNSILIALFVVSCGGGGSGGSSDSSEIIAPLLPTEQI